MRVAKRTAAHPRQDPKFRDPAPRLAQTVLRLPKTISRRKNRTKCTRRDPAVCRMNLIRRLTYPVCSSVRTMTGHLRPFEFLVSQRGWLTGKQRLVKEMGWPGCTRAFPPSFPIPFPEVKNNVNLSDILVGRKLGGGLDQHSHTHRWLLRVRSRRPFGTRFSKGGR